MQNPQEEYLKAFRGESDAEENMADPVVDESAAEGDAETPAVSMTIDAANAVDAGNTPADEQAVAQEAAAEGEPVAEEMAEQGAPEEAMEGQGEEISPEDIQRQKSWEGRLRKREEELAAREASMSAAPAAGDDSSDEEINEIRQRLADDFGEEFVAMIGKLAAHEAKKLAASSIDDRIEPINASIDNVIAQMQDAFAQQHFQTISDVHEDWLDVANSGEFQSWLDSLPEGEKEQASAVIDNGTAGQVIKLLAKYKKAINSGVAEEAPEMEDLSDALDAASSVRGSSPVTLPERAPAGAEDEYKSAWASM